MLIPGIGSLGTSGVMSMALIDRARLMVGNRHEFERALVLSRRAEIRRLGGDTTAWREDAVQAVAMFRSMGRNPPPQEVHVG